jgi:nitroreductase
MNAVLEAIRSRRSVRRYQDALLSREELEQIVEAGTWAPSGHNQQPWHFAVVQDRTLIGELNDKTKAAMARIDVDWIKKMGENPSLDVTHGAPALVLVSCVAGAVSGPTDCVAAMQNMMLAAQGLGIGSCWMGFVGFVFDDTALMNRLGVPEGYRPQQAAVFGRPADDAAAQAPARKPDVASYIGQF